MPRSAAFGTHYELAGPQDAPAVVLIHGLGLTSETWDDYVPRLAQNYRVLTYDLTGHGKSAAPVAPPSLTLFADQLRELMDELAIDRASILGFSLGGMINRRLAMDHPERVSSLVIMNSPHDRGEEAQKLVEQRALDTQAGGPGATLDATIERWFTEEFRHNRPDVIERIRNGVLANEHDVYAQCRWVLANGVRELINPEPPITHPTLIMTCENDSGSTPHMSHQIAREISGSETIIVDHLQHMGLVERADLFLEPILAFLGRHSG